MTISRQLGFSLERAGAEAARHRAEEELRELEQRFRLMSEHAPVMIWMSHPNGACMHLNKMLRAFWGVQEDGLDLFDWTATMHPDDAADIGRQMMDAMSKQTSVVIKGRYLQRRATLSRA